MIIFNVNDVGSFWEKYINDFNFEFLNGLIFGEVEEDFFLSKVVIFQEMKLKINLEGLNGNDEKGFFWGSIFGKLWCEVVKVFDKIYFDLVECEIMKIVLQKC